MSEEKGLGDYIDKLDNKDRDNLDKDIKFRFRKSNESLDSLENLDK